jgi:hypothetical protein
MKLRILSLIVFVFGALLNASGQDEKVYPKIEYKVITSVESIVPNGLGRSRLVSANVDRTYSDFTSDRSSDKSEDERNKSRRSDIRVEDFEETKLLNFYNLGGIRFQNIVANDAVIGSKLTAMAEEGWELAFVSSNSESDAGNDDGQGIFVTRYIFKRVQR